MAKYIKELKKVQKGATNEQLKLGISRYAAASNREANAEACADYYTNGNNAAPLSLEIMKLLKEFFK